MSEKLPGWNQRNAPDVITPVDGGHVEVYFRGKEDPPEEYDYSVPHKTRKGMRVFFRFVVYAAILACILLVLIEVGRQIALAALPLAP